MSDTQVPELVEIFDVQKLSIALAESAMRIKQLEELIESYASHDSWRCSFYNACHCGLSDELTKLGLPEIPIK
jgi:hypothetical protein